MINTARPRAQAIRVPTRVGWLHPVGDTDAVSSAYRAGVCIVHANPAAATDGRTAPPRAFTCTSSPSAARSSATVPGHVVTAVDTVTINRPSGRVRIVGVDVRHREFRHPNCASSPEVAAGVFGLPARKTSRRCHSPLDTSSRWVSNQAMTAERFQRFTLPIL